MAQSENPLVQNLLDAGIDTDVAVHFSALLKSGTAAQQMQLLKEQRVILLDNLHDSQRRLDLLDHLIYTMKKERKTNE